MAHIVDAVPDPLSSSLAATVQQVRRDRDLTVRALAEQSGVSRAMIGKIDQISTEPRRAFFSSAREHTRNARNCQFDVRLMFLMPTGS